MSEATDNKEASAHLSEPLEFYRFTVDTTDYLYTSADTDIYYLGRKYLKAAIQRGNIDGTTDPDKGTLKLTAPYLLPIVTQILVISPSFPISLTIYRTQRRTDTTVWSGVDENPSNYLTVGEADQIWTGRVFSCEITGDEVSINCVSILNQQFRMGNTLKYQRACQYALYDGYNCRVSPTYLRTTLLIQLGEVTTSKVTAAGLVWGAFPESIGKDVALKDHWFLGGYLTYFDNFSKVEGRRAITGYDPAAGIVTVFPPFRDPLLGDPDHPMRFHPGCEHNSTDCHKKFANIENYGGDTVIPTKDPYDPFERILQGGGGG